MKTLCSRCGAPITNIDQRCPNCGSLGTLPNDPMLGKQVGPYLIERRLALGGFGFVYEASGPQRAAIKILHQQKPDPEMVTRFQREALALQRISHPSIAEVYEKGQTSEGALWLAMELIEGETLEKRLQRKRVLSTEETLALLLPLCRLLSEVHQEGIVHRDITTANIMLPIHTERPPVLLDFGFAWLRGEASITETGVISGTAQYMSPEQWEGLHHASALSDLYALGVIAYECLSGKLPVEAKSPLDWLRKHSLSAPIDLAAVMSPPIPEKLCAAIMKAIAKRPEERFASIEDFRMALLA
jgi:serine/threonine protein kinase